MIELEKMYILTINTFNNFDAYQIIKISFVLYNTHMIFKNQEKITFYINNYVNQNQFNQ